jgi:hypothetical protein
MPEKKREEKAGSESFRETPLTKTTIEDVLKHLQDVKRSKETEFYTEDKDQERLWKMVTNDRTNFYNEEGGLIRSNKAD